MPLYIQIAIFLLVSLSIVAGLLSALKAQREDLSYRQIALWLISPVRLLVGLTFFWGDKKKQYFRKIKSDLFIT
jgi:hypothetical protein